MRPFCAASPRRVLTAVCALAMLLPATSVLAADAAADDPNDELEDVERRIDEAEDDIDEVDRDRVVTIDDIARIDGELAVLDADLAELTGRLGLAQQELDDVEARLAATTAQLVATEQELTETRGALAAERERFVERTRASYMYGSADPTTAALSARSVAEFAAAMEYVEHIVTSDRDRVTRVEGMVRLVDAQTVELEALGDKQSLERADAKGKRDEVAQLVAEEQAARDLVAAQRYERQLVLNQLDSDRATHLQLVDSLEAESAALEEELRRIAEEARQAALAKEARQAEEERRETAAAGRAESGGGGDGGPPASSPGRLQRPSDGRVTSGYGWRHHPIHGTRRFHAGIDFGPGYGAPIYAASAGVVLSAGTRGGYGRTIVLNHGDGMTTLYAHQSRFAVGAGAEVSRGQVIGYVGSTGYSTGPHLHFEVRINGSTRNPADYL